MAAEEASAPLDTLLGVARPLNALFVTGQHGGVNGGLAMR
jgi:hypothetical protein